MAAALVKVGEVWATASAGLLVPVFTALTGATLRRGFGKPSPTGIISGSWAPAEHIFNRGKVIERMQVEYGKFVSWFEDRNDGVVRCLNGGPAVHVHRRVVSGIAKDDVPRVGESCSYTITPDSDFASPEAASCIIGITP
jgi:hypothetical protein